MPSSQHKHMIISCDALTAGDRRFLHRNHPQRKAAVAVSHAGLPVVTEDGIDVDISDVTALYELFSQVNDPRKPRGVRHEVAAVLTLLSLAALCGAGNFRQAADRVVELPAPLLSAAGTRTDIHGRPAPPSRDTLRRVAEKIDAAAADRLVCQWIIARISSADTPTRQPGLAIDGKTVRASSPHDPTDNVTLFSAMLHNQAVVIAQLHVPTDSTEVTQVEALLDPIDIAGTVVTADAAHPSSATATYLHQRHADYVFTVKANKPRLLTSITQRLPAATADTAAHTSHEHRSGHIVERRIWTADADGIDFPAAAQVFRIRRDTYDLDGQRLHKHIVHGITSLTSPHTSADIASYVRQHWGIENKIHWVRDVLFAEDHHHAWRGATAHTMALLRNLVIALIRLAGHTRIKQVLERLHGNKMLILPLLRASRP